MTTANDWITVREAANRLGVHRTLVLRLVQAGRIRGRKEPPAPGHNGYWKISPRSVEEYAAEPKPPGGPGRPARHPSPA